MTQHRGHLRRLVAGAGAALALVGGSLAAAAPRAHVPTYRYYALYRTDARAHRIIGTLHYTYLHSEASAMEVVLETRKGRQYPFDRGSLGPGAPLYASAAGHTTPACDDVACTLAPLASSSIYVDIPVWFDYLVATRDATVTLDLSQSPDKHWAFKEITGDARVTGRLHVLMPGDGEGESVSVPGGQVQRIRDFAHPGGRYGSVALARMPYDPLGVTNIGSAQLDGGQAYMEGVSRLGGRRWEVCGWTLRPTTWRLHGDLTAVGYGGGPTMLVYDLPDPKAMRAMFRGRR